MLSSVLCEGIEKKIPDAGVHQGFFVNNVFIFLTEQYHPSVYRSLFSYYFNIVNSFGECA